MVITADTTDLFARLQTPAFFRSVPSSSQPLLLRLFIPLLNNCSARPSEFINESALLPRPTPKPQSRDYTGRDTKAFRWKHIDLYVISLNGTSTLQARVTSTAESIEKDHEGEDHSPALLLSVEHRQSSREHALPEESRLRGIFSHAPLLTHTCASPWSSRTKFPRKKSGDLHMVQNYMYSNSLTVKNSYPMRRMEPVINRLAGPNLTHFFQADGTNGYWTIPLFPPHLYKTAFPSYLGQVCYCRMGQGLTGAPSAYTQFRDIATEQEMSPEHSRFSSQFQNVARYLLEKDLEAFPGSESAELGDH